MTKRQPCIYKITNLVDGKVYIGQTNRTFKERKKDHLSCLRRNKHSNPLFQNAWNKYGEKNFVFEVIQECTENELDDLERFWIELFNSMDKKIGYNLDSGGNKGKIASKETLLKMSEVTKSRGWINGKHPNAKKVIRINDGKIFDCMKEAGKSVGISTGAIYHICCGNNHSTTDVDGVRYQFAYYEEGKTYSLKDVEGIRINTPKKVICVNTGEIFSSMHEAAARTGVSQSKISLVCNRERLTAGKMPNGDKMVWRFLEDYDENEKNDLKKINKIPDFKKKKKVKCTTTNEIFESVREACRKYNLKSPVGISHVCKGIQEYAGKLSDGTKLKWVYYDEHLSI